MSRSRRVLWIAWLVLALLVSGALPAQAKHERKTKTLVLPNGLAVYLMSDLEVDRSAAALSVGVGHLYDPDEKPGLAHYLEHMLFLGTKKYPDVEDFKKYLNAHSGASNAYTGPEVTNFFFQVSHEAFEGALDRFSQFFKAPLFDRKYAEREVHAVDNEFEKNKLQDGWRASFLINQVAEPGHPIRKFGIGNKQTLAGDNRKALLDFYQKYYAASNMKLAVLSNIPLVPLEQLVREYFSDIKDHPVQFPTIDPEFRKPLEAGYRLLKIKTIKDVRSLSLEFPTIRLADHLESKPASIVGSVIGHEGKGSLLSKLKDEGLALGLSAGGGFSHPNLSTFDININLTRKGEQEYHRVLELVFSYIEELRRTGIYQYTYDENRKMAQIDFDWKEPQEGMGYAAGQAALMQHFPLEEVETLPYLFKKHEPRAYRALLKTLRPENALVVLSSRNVQGDQKEKFFGTEYSLTEVRGEPFQALKQPPPPEGMTYPEPNDFIPENLVLHEETPHLIRDDEIAKIYFMFDHRFEKPKVYMKFLIETPHVYDHPSNLAKSKLYEAAIMEGLNEITYPISLAGLSYSLGLEKKGVTLTVGGYSERLPDLIRLVTDNLRKIKISRQKFADIKDEAIRSLENAKLGQAYIRASYYNRQIWLERQFTEEQLLEGLRPVTYEAIQSYADTLFEKVFITGVIYGNWTEEQGREAVALVIDELNSEPLPEEERFKEKVVVLDEAEQLRFSAQVHDNNNALFYTLQLGPRNFESTAIAQLIASIVESDFYTQMRTKQQLGYIVWSFSQSVEDRLFFKMIIQSSKYSPFEMQKRVEAWIQRALKIFDTLRDDQFDQHRRGLIVSLEKKPDSIAEVTGELYYFAVDEKGDFEHKRKLIETVKKLTKEEVVARAREWFGNPAIARSVVLIRSNSSKEKVPEGVLTEIAQIKQRNGRQAQAPEPARF